MPRVRYLGRADFFLFAFWSFRWNIRLARVGPGSDLGSRTPPNALQLTAVGTQDSQVTFLWVASSSKFFSFHHEESFAPVSSTSRLVIASII